jgi:hypothetical protein
MTLNNTIILSAGAFGSIYLFSTMLTELNKYWLKNVKIPYYFYILNGFVIIGSSFTYGYLLYSYFEVPNAGYTNYFPRQQSNPYWD